MALPFQDRQRPDEATNRYHSFRNDFDTVTVLGFSSYVHPNQIVDFFTSKEGHCWCVSINNYPPRVVLRFSSPIVAQRIVLRYDNANVFGQRLRVVPASIHREQENERNILQPVRISPALYGSYTPRIFPKHVQPNSMAMSVVNNGTSFLKLAKVFLVQKALQDGKIQNPRKIETPLLQNQGFQSPMLGNTPNRSTLLDTRHQNYNKNNPWKPSSCTGNLQKNTSKESLTSKSKADKKNSLAGNKKTANDCDEGIRSKDQTIINKEEDKKVKGPFKRRKRRRKSRGRKRNSISSNTAADFKNSCSKADLPADKKIVKGNEVLMKETKQSVGVEVKCPTSGEKEIDARCRKTAQSSGKNCGIMAAVSDNNDNHTERKTLTHSDNSHTRTRDQCEENNVSVSDIKSSNCPVDGSRNKCDKDECKQSVIVNKESNTAKNCCLYNKGDGSGLGTTKKCSTDSSYKKFSGGNKSDKADQQSSGAGMYTSKGKGCGKNNESSKSMLKDKGFLKSSMTNISQETNTNGDGIRTSITKGKLEATHGFPKASGNKNSVPQRNMATEKHWVNTSRGKGSQKRNQSDVAGLKKINGESNGHNKCKSKYIKSSLKNDRYIVGKDSMTSNNAGQGTSGSRKPAKDVVPSAKISLQNSDSKNPRKTQNVPNPKTSSKATQKKYEGDQMKGTPTEDSLETISDKNTSNNSSQTRIDIQNATQRSISKEYPCNKNSSSNSRQPIILNSGKTNFQSLMSIETHRPQRGNGVKRKRKETTHLAVSPSKKTCLGNRSTEVKGNDVCETTKLLAPERDCPDIMRRENVSKTTSEARRLVLTLPPKTPPGTKSIKTTHKPATKKVVGCRDLRDLLNKKTSVIFPAKKIATGGSQKSGANNVAKNTLMKKNRESGSAGKSGKSENRKSSYDCLNRYEKQGTRLKNSDEKQNPSKNIFIEAKGQAIVKPSVGDSKSIYCSNAAGGHGFGQLKNSGANNDASTEKNAEKQMKTISNTLTKNVTVKTSNGTTSNGNTLKISKSMNNLNKLEEGKGLTATKKCPYVDEKRFACEVSENSDLMKSTSEDKELSSRKSETSSEQSNSGMDGFGEESQIAIEETSFSNRNCLEQNSRNITRPRVSSGSCLMKVSSENQNNCSMQENVVKINADIDKPSLIHSRDGAQEDMCETNIRNKSNQSNKEKINQSESVPASKRSEKESLKKDLPIIATVTENQQQQTTTLGQASVQKTNGLINTTVLARLKSLNFSVQKSIKVPEENGGKSLSVDHGNTKSVETKNKLDKHFACEAKTIVSKSARHSLSLLPKMKKSAEASNTLDSEISKYVYRTRLKDSEIVDPKAVTYTIISGKVLQEHKNSESQSKSIVSYAVSGKHVEQRDIVSGSSESPAPNTADFIERSSTNEPLAIEEIERLRTGEAFTQDNSNHTSRTGNFVSEVKQETQLQNDEILTKNNPSYSTENDVPNFFTTKIRTDQLSQNLATVSHSNSDIVKIEKTTTENEENFNRPNVPEKVNENPDKPNTDSKSVDKAAPSFSCDIVQVIKSTIDETLSEDRKGYSIKNEHCISKSEDVPVSQSIVCSKVCATAKTTSASSQKIIESSIEMNPIPLFSETKLDRGASTSGYHKNRIQEVTLNAKRFGAHGSDRNLMKSGLVEKSPLPNFTGDPSLVINSSKNTLDTLVRGSIGSNGMPQNFGFSERYPAPISSDPRLQQTCNQNYIPSSPLANAKCNTQNDLSKKKKQCRRREAKNRRRKRLRKIKIQSLKKGTESNVQSEKSNGAVRPLNETKCRAGDVKEAGISVNKDALSVMHESQATKDALKEVFQTDLYQGNGGRNSVRNCQEISIKSINEKAEKQTRQASMPETRWQNSETVSNDTKLNGDISEPALTHSIKCSGAREGMEDSSSFAPVAHSVRCEKGFIQSRRETKLNYPIEGTQDESNCGTLFGVCHEDNDGFAISGKRKQKENMNGEKREDEWESSKRQRCGKKMENIGLNQAVVVENVELSEKEHRGKQQESVFLWTNIKAMEVQYNKECNSMLKSVKMLASMNPSLTERLKVTFKESLEEMGRKLLSELYKLKQKNDEWKNQHRAIRLKGNVLHSAGKDFGETKNEEKVTESNMYDKNQPKVHQDACFKLKQGKVVAQVQSSNEENQIQDPLNGAKATITQSLKTCDQQEIKTESGLQNDVHQENNYQTNPDQQDKILHPIV